MKSTITANGDTVTKQPIYRVLHVLKLSKVMRGVTKWDKNVQDSDVVTDYHTAIVKSAFCIIQLKSVSVYRNFTKQIINSKTDSIR